MDPGLRHDNDGQDNQPLNRHPDDSQDPAFFLVMLLALIECRDEHGFQLSLE